MNDDDEDPLKIYEQQGIPYERTTQQPGVDGILERIEEAEIEAVGLHCNQRITFAGVICPIVCEEGNRVQIQHGNNLLWIPKEEAMKALPSAEGRKTTAKWDSIYRNPLLPPHRP